VERVEAEGREVTRKGRRRGEGNLLTAEKKHFATGELITVARKGVKKDASQGSSLWCSGADRQRWTSLHYPDNPSTNENIRKKSKAKETRVVWKEMTERQPPRRSV